MRFAAILKSVRLRGVIQPVLRWKSEVLDGRKVLKACDTLDLKASFLDATSIEDAAQLLFGRHPRRALERFCSGLAPAQAAQMLDVPLGEISNHYRGWQRPRTSRAQGAQMVTVWMPPTADGMIRSVALELGVSRSDMLRLGAWFLANRLGSQQMREGWAMRQSNDETPFDQSLPIDTSESGLEWVTKSDLVSAALDGTTLDPTPYRGKRLRKRAA